MQPGLGRLRLDARFSARLLGGERPSQIREQGAVMPQKEGSSEREDASELPSDGESLKAGRRSCLVGTGTTWRPTDPLHSSGAAWSQGFSVSTLSRAFILRRLRCQAKFGGQKRERETEDMFNEVQHVLVRLMGFMNQ